MIKFTEYKASARSLGSILLQNARLKATDLLVRLLSAFLIGAIALIITAIAIFFFTAGVAFELCETMNPIWAFSIVGLFYIVLFILIFLFRKAIIINPLCIIFSKIIISNPNTPSDDDEKQQPTQPAAAVNPVVTTDEGNEA